MPGKILDIDLAQATTDVAVDGKYDHALILVRWQRRPVGQLQVAIADGRVSLQDVWARAREYYGDQLAGRCVESLLFGGGAARPSATCPCTVIVCTRDRPSDLQRCVESLLQCDPPPAEIVVVDNAPPNDATERVAARYPVRYVVEPRKGLNWARTRGARAATLDIVLYTDDDVVVDPGWPAAMCAPFDDPQVAATTGLVLALELETVAQEAFERYYGFSRGIRDVRFTMANLDPVEAGKAGAGASMAFRRNLVNGLRLFECELDCGTAAQSGGDNYAFYRLLDEGFAIYYTTAALCRHRHRRTEEELLATLHGYGVGLYSFLLRCIDDHRDWSALRAGVSWFLSSRLRNVLRALLRRPDVLPRQYSAAEIKGALAAFRAYRRTRRAEREWNRSQPSTKEAS
jgi:glycosyltransferase involved in cell wall biosynthesis